MKRSASRSSNSRESKRLKIEGVKEGKDRIKEVKEKIEVKKAAKVELDKVDRKPVPKTEALAEDPRSRHCPYLDTIKRHMLDFDFEKLCSISLSHLNVYACLVCGKYFQGRGTNTHAHTHSVDEEHHVFLNLETHKFFCLPDNYEIKDSSLDDIIYLLNPTFSKQEIQRLDTHARLVRAYDGNTYHPGIVGVNNIKVSLLITASRGSYLEHLSQSFFIFLWWDVA